MSLSSALVNESSKVSVTLKDDGCGESTSVEYVMRGLQETEISGWAHFCASVFRHKANPPPPSYFERHFWNDPSREALLIRVILHDGQIVSSCRIFRRTVRMGTDVEAGGIGEVCTSEQHRNRGLSKLLLENCILIMTELGMEVSLLHAAPDFFPVYESRDYVCVSSRWSLVTLLCTKLSQQPTAFECRLAQFPADTPRLQALHQEYSERKFVGCVVRSQEYWNDYLSKELEGSLWTLIHSKTNQVVAWSSLRLRGDCFQLREFGCDTNAVNLADAMSMLLSRALDTTQQEVYLHLPTHVVEKIRRSGALYVDWSTLEAKDDHGWMYKPLLHDTDDGEKSMLQLTETIPHLIWPADSF